MQLLTSSNGYWRFFADKDKLKTIDDADIGKWMVFYLPPQGADIITLCSKAVTEGMVVEAKCVEDSVLERRDSGVACFYVHGHDVEAHRKLLPWMFDNNLIRFDHEGHLQHIDFKYDWQTRAGLYGDDFIAPMTSADFLTNQGQLKTAS